MSCPLVPAASVTTAVAAALASMAACSIPEKQLVDGAAKGPPFACFGQPLPSTANQKVTISGVLLNTFTQTPVPGAPIEVHLLKPDVLITTLTTADAGTFSYDQATGGTPQDAYLRAAPSGFVETRYYPAVPIASDLVAEIQILTPMDLMTIATVAGISIDMTKATFLVSVVDCNGDSVAGATITTTPPGTMLYFANGRPSTTAVVTDSFTGTAVAANVAAGTTTITAVVGTRTLTREPFESAPGVLSQTEIQP